MTEKERALIQLAPGDMQEFEYVSRRFAATIPQGVTREDLKNPGFWAHHANTLRPFNEIRALALDGTWVAYYIVVDSAKTWAKVEELSYHELSGTLAAESEAEVQAFIAAHQIVFRGPHKWSVIRKDDSAVLTQAIAEKEAAFKWLDSHARTQIGGAALKVA